MKTTKQLLLGLLLLALPALLFAGSPEAAGAAAPGDSSLAPWIGVWTPLADRPDNPASDANSQAIVEIRPTADGKGLAISRKTPQQPEVKETLILDGSKQPVDAKDCSGWQSSKWVPEIAAIIGSSEVTCKDSGSFSTTSLKMMLAADQMVDIFGIKTGDQTRLATRRLRFSSDLPSAGSSRSGPAGIAARMAASAPWKLEGILNLSGTVGVPILQAALVEKNVQLNMNAKSLKKMQAAGLPKEIVDLLVALAYPREFYVQTDGRVKLQSVSDSTAGLSGSSYFPSSYYYSSPYSYYYYDNWFYYRSPFWSDYYFVFVPSYGYIPGGGSNSPYSGGYASSSKGYVQIAPVDTGRHAVPRGSYVPQGNSSSGTYSSPPAIVSGGSSGSSSTPSSDGGGSSSGGGGASSSSGGGASASPSGYSSGSSGGGSAVPRP